MFNLLLLLEPRRSSHLDVYVVLECRHAGYCRARSIEFEFSHVLGGGCGCWCGGNLNSISIWKFLSLSFRTMNGEWNSIENEIELINYLLGILSSSSSNLNVWLCCSFIPFKFNSPLSPFFSAASRSQRESSNNMQINTTQQSAKARWQTTSIKHR